MILPIPGQAAEFMATYVFVDLRLLFPWISFKWVADPSGSIKSDQYGSVLYGFFYWRLYTIYETLIINIINNITIAADILLKIDNLRNWQIGKFHLRVNS